MRFFKGGGVISFDVAIPFDCISYSIRQVIGNDGGFIAFGVKDGIGDEGLTDFGFAPVFGGVDYVVEEGGFSGCAFDLKDHVVIIAVSSAINADIFHDEGVSISKDIGDLSHLHSVFGVGGRQGE